MAVHPAVKLTRNRFTMKCGLLRSPVWHWNIAFLILSCWNRSRVQIFRYRPLSESSGRYYQYVSLPIKQKIRTHFQSEISSDFSCMVDDIGLFRGLKNMPPACFLRSAERRPARWIAASRQEKVAWAILVLRPRKKQPRHTARLILWWTHTI